MENKHDFYPETGFGGFTAVDGTVHFYTRVNALLGPEATVLDVGCGRGTQLGDSVPYRKGLRILRGKVAHVIGIDVDEDAHENECVDEVRMIEAGHWPLEDGSVDLAFADNVLEHVDDVEGFFREAERILKPGGFFCARTPNLLSYVGVTTRLVPNRWHAAILRRAQAHRRGGDPYPTLFRCNTRKRLAAALREAGLDPVVYTWESEPGYLDFSRAFYGLGVLYQRLAPAAFRTVLMAFAEKRSD